MESVACGQRDGGEFSVTLPKAENLPSTCTWLKKILGVDPSVEST